MFTISPICFFLTSSPQFGGGGHWAHEALLQRVLHRCPQATGENCGFHLRPLPGDQWEAWKEH